MEQWDVDEIDVVVDIGVIGVECGYCLIGEVCVSQYGVFWVVGGVCGVYD